MITQLRLTMIAAILISFTGFGYIGYTKIKDIGFQEATAICTLNFKKYEAEREARIAEVEATARTLVANNKRKSNKLTEQMNETIKQLKNQPLVVLKENNCELTETFSDSFSKINHTANQSMKDTKK